MNPRWLMRAKRWAQNPPSPARVKFILGLVAALLALALYEHFFGWPAALTVNSPPRVPRY